MVAVAYGMTAKVKMPYAQAVEAVTAALRDEGFGVLTTIDVKKTLKEKVGADFDEYVILGACNPSLAYTALKDDIELGLLLPCNVVVRREGEGSVVSILDPGVMARLSDAPGLAEVARIAREKLERVLRQVKGSGS
jgi:uncharacterized protein (DUF302 family)